MIITIADQKGGVGKSTTAAALAQGLTYTHKRKTALLIDADAQGTATKSIYGTTADNGGLYDVLHGAPPEDLIQTTPAGDILPYSPELAALDLELIDNDNRDKLIKEAITPLRAKYDYMIIDTAPGLSTTLAQALSASDLVIIPLQAAPAAIDGLEAIINTARDVKKYVNKDLRIGGALLTQYNVRANLTRQYEALIGNICASLKVKLLDTRIRQGIAIQEAQALKQSLYDYAPKSKPAADYLSLIKELKL